MKSRMIKMLVLGIKQFSKPYYQGFAAQLAFYFILSLVPVLLLISQALTAVFSQNLQEAVGWLMNYLGDIPFANQINKLVTGSGSGAMSIVFIIIAIWAASRAQFALMRITNYTFSSGETTGRGFWRDRFRAVLTMSVTILTIIFAIVVLMYGDVVLSLILKLLGMEEAAGKVWLVLRWPIAIVLYFLMISYNYYVLPSKKVKFRSIIPGSAFAAIGLMVVTAIYSKYVSNIANYNVLYGSLATIVALMFWFFFLSWVLVLGILFNKVWADTKEIE